MVETERNESTRTRRKILAFVWALGLLALFAGSVFDASYWSAKLSAEAVRRASSRYSTADGALASSGRDRSSAATEKEARRAAEDYFASSASPRSRAAIEREFSRWDFDRALPRRKMKAIREDDEEATRAAIDALTEFGEASELDDALAFLRELDEESCLESGERACVSLDFRSGNPLDSVAFVAPSDFAISPSVARRSLDASSRLFFLATLGGLLPFSRVRRVWRTIWERALSALESVSRLSVSRVARFSSRSIFPVFSLVELSSVRLLV